MRVLVTAGATNAPIDKVRTISNIFRGTTGAKIAEYFALQNNCNRENTVEVTLVTSNPNVELDPRACIQIYGYKTFDDLQEIMQEFITQGNFDVIVHSAAVSDYKVEGVYIQEDGGLSKIDNSKKISSTHTDMYLRLVPTIKLVDQIREPWGFKGLLVKFKLQVGISEDELLEIAKNSMLASDADFIVANCLEWSKERAFILDKLNDDIISVSRNDLPEELYNAVQSHFSHPNGWR